MGRMSRLNSTASDGAARHTTSAINRDTNTIVSSLWRDAGDLRDGRRMQVRQATIADLDVLVPLFDAYRQFYRASSDPNAARQFLLDRFSHNQSIVFLAFEGDAGVGFTQLYPSFSSVSMARIFI